MLPKCPTHEEMCAITRFPFKNTAQSKIFRLKLQRQMHYWIQGAMALVMHDKSEEVTASHVHRAIRICDRNYRRTIWFSRRCWSRLTIGLPLRNPFLSVNEKRKLKRHLRIPHWKYK